MKLNIICFILILLGMIYDSLGLKTKNSSTNSSSNSNTNTTGSKTSIFESFKIYLKEGKHVDSNKVQGAFSIKAPMNPFDPNGKPFSPSATFKSDSTFAANGDVDLPDTTIFYKGWAKFFRFLYDDNSKTPKAFFENPEYTEQFKKFQTGQELKQKQDGQYLYPTQKNNFWMIITKDQILFSKSRLNAFQTVYDTLKIHYISPISEDQGFIGGIKNMGSFKEGDCMKVSTDSAGRYTWVICVEDSQTKINIMGTIKKIVIKSQRDRGMVLTGEHPNDKESKFSPGAKQASTLAGAMAHSSENSDSNAMNDLKDGYWMILQDWSTCTKFCGGGTQTLHRMCIPPKKGGQPCEGQAIVTRKCNDTPCPGSDNKIILPTPKDGNSTKVELMEPKMTVLPFSDRPQRYDKCHLKESDLLYTQTLMNSASPKGKSTVKAIQMPVRVVMNQFTVSAFAGMNETDIKISFDLDKTDFHPSARDPTCFILKEHGHFEVSFSKKPKSAGPSEAEFCPFGASVSTETSAQWNYDFNLFKNQCHQVREKNLVEGAISDEEIENALKKKKGELRIDIAAKKKQKIKMNEHVPTYTEKMKKSSLEAIQKELKLENMIENEIKESQKDAIELKAQELEKEKHKLDCLNKAIKEKQIENEMNVASANKKSRLDDIKKNVVDTINVKRQRLKSKIAKLKKLGENTLNDYDSQIQNIRIEMMNSISDEPSYNPSACKILAQAGSGEAFELQKKNYCDDKLMNDPEEHSRCISSDLPDLLHLCCDNETDPSIPSDFKKCLGEHSKHLEGGSTDVRFFWGKPYQRLLADEGGSTMNSSGHMSSQTTSMHSSMRSSTHSETKEYHSSEQSSQKMSMTTGNM